MVEHILVLPLDMHFVVAVEEPPAPVDADMVRRDAHGHVAADMPVRDGIPGAVVDDGLVGLYPRPEGVADVHLSLGQR